ncbi:serine hydrolase [Fontimonas sp. SYSU GA230001]|uniref:serine hydrolase n=1 Tax=Fontimonas sp. SYSU GA230001 TaxID=3142450 RepID=UPI0032B4ACB7
MSSLLGRWCAALFVCLPLLAVAAPESADLDAARDARLQTALSGAVERLGLTHAIARRQLSVALVDLADPAAPRYAGLNDGDMVYGASLPKIAILLGAFARIEDGTLTLTPELRRDLEDMIRRSSNTAATRVFEQVGPDYLAELLSSERYALYDRDHGGGLWVGKPYGPGEAYRRDPLFNLSHGASAYQAARFYYLLETGRLVSPAASHAMKEIMGKPAIDHKFVKAIKASYPQAALYRKSGTWRDYHCDSALVEHDGKRYIIVALSHAEQGAQWLEQLALAADALIAPGSAPPVR